MTNKATPRKRVWLEVNGHTDTLRKHIVKAGYRLGYESTISKKYKCKASEIPVEVLSEYLGGTVRRVDMPEDSASIMYRSKKSKSAKKDSTSRFLSMILSRNPKPCSYY